MKKQAESWLEAAKSDLIVIEEIVDREDVAHMVAFHSQQAIEKSYKAALEEYDQFIPKTHNIITLSKKVEKIVEIDIDEDLIDQLNDLYIDSRYPTDVGFLPDGKPSVEKAKVFYKYARKTYDLIIKKITNK